MAAGQCRLALAHRAHQRAEAARIARVLVGRQMLERARDERIDRFEVRHHRLQRVAQQRGAGRRISCMEPPQREGELVVLHRYRVELERAQHRRQAERHPAVLPGATKGDHVGIDRVAEVVFRQALRIQRLEPVLAGGKA